MSQHYTLTPLTPAIHAAIATAGGSAISNAGIVDLGDATLVIDTFLTPTAAEDLRRDAERLTGRAPRWVVNTHYHNDHIWGNQVFLPDAQIVSTFETRHLIETAGQEEFDEYRSVAADRLAAAQQQLAAATTDVQRSAATMWVGYYDGLVRDFPRLTLTLPTMLFARRMVLHGSQRRVELLAFEGGHTGNDAVVLLPDDGIVFMADLLFVGAHPFLGDGNPDLWQAALASILDGSAGIDATRFVPGHGPVTGRDDVQRVIDYIADCKDIADRLRSSESPDVNAEPVPAKYADWGFPSFFPRNLTFLLKGQAKRY